MYDMHNSAIYPAGGTKLLGTYWNATFTGLNHSGSPYTLKVTDTKGNHDEHGGLTVS
jgi:hypothetical protein